MVEAATSAELWSKLVPSVWPQFGSQIFPPSDWDGNTSVMLIHRDHSGVQPVTCMLPNILGLQ